MWTHPPSALTQTPESCVILTHCNPNILRPTHRNRIVQRKQHLGDAFVTQTKLRAGRRTLLGVRSHQRIYHFRQSRGDATGAGLYCLSGDDLNVEVAIRTWELL